MRAQLILLFSTGLLLLSGCGDKGTEAEKEIRKWSVSGTVVRIQTSVPIPGAKAILGLDTSVTDSAGKYLIADVIEGAYPISVVCDSFGYYHDNITVKRNLIYNVPLVPAVRLYGKVFDHLSQPVTGAIVSVGGAVDTSAEDGSYAIANASSGFRQITCIHPGHYPFQDTLTILVVPTQFDIHLYPAANLFGFVYRDGGLPLVGAVVSMAGISDTSGTLGEFELRLVPLGQQTLSCAHSDYFDYSATIVVTEKPKRFDVVMDNLVNLTGTVYHPVDGPIEGAIVTVGGLTDVTDAYGHYEFRNVPLGQQSITCTHFDYFTFSGTVVITTSRVIFDIELNSQLNLIGTVYHQTYGPIEGAIVSIAGLTDTSLAGGYYQFWNVPVGEQEINCTHPQYFFEPDTIMISQSQTVYDLQMYYAVVETLYVSEDATVQLNNLVDSTSYQNFGGSDLQVYAEIFFEDNEPGPAGDVTYIGYKRFFLKLPYPSVPSHFLHAELIIYGEYVYVDYYNGNQIRYVGSSSDWNESEICWANQPYVPNGGDYFTMRSNGFIHLDVTKYYQDSASLESSLAFVTAYTPPYQCTMWYRFCSSESTDPVYRPKVIITAAY